jgi:hypothetical protein
MMRPAASSANLPVGHLGAQCSSGSGRIFQKATAIDGVELNLSERVLGDRYKYCPNADQSHTGPTNRRQPFTKKDGSDQSNEDNAEFVDWSDLRDLAELKGPEVTKPGCTGRQSRQDQEQARLRRRAWKEAASPPLSRPASQGQQRRRWSAERLRNSS